jgi:N-acetylmuramoyl-L-alanine amidase CwlA
MTYQITHDYIKHGNARPGTPLEGPLFGVAHDTGNPGSTARQNRNYFNNQQPQASAQVFIDDKEILVIIPLNEKAYHVQYQKPYDNQRFGEDANDAGIGVELCWGPGIKFEEAYKRYVWFWAWLCKKYNWNPHEKIASHKQLDPERRTDPDNALNRHGITWDEFLNDVKKEMSITTAALKPKDDKRYRLMTGTFKSAEDLVRAKQTLKEKYGWLLYEKATNTEWNPWYRIVTGTFVGRNVAEHYAAELKKEYGWTIYIEEA